MQDEELRAPLAPSGPPADGQACDLEAVEGSSTSAGLPFQGSVLSRAFLAWVFPLLERSATQGQLVTSDLFVLQQQARPEVLQQSFAEAWRAELLRRSRRRGPPREGRSFLRVIWRLHLRRLFWLWLGRLFEALLAFTYPLFLNLLLRFAEDESVPRWRGLVYAAGLFGLQFAAVVLDQSLYVALTTVGLKVHAAMTTAIFRKVLLLRQDAAQGFSSGQLHNLITTDVDKVRRFVRYAHNLLAAPIQMTVALASLHTLVGVAVWISLSWLAVVVCLNPVVFMFASWQEDHQQSKTDERVRRATEAVSSIHLVKCYAWERPTTARVEAARREELSSLSWLYVLYIAMECLWTSVVPVTTALMFTAYALIYPDSPLTAAQAFTALTLLDMLQEPLFTVPWVMSLATEAIVAGKRMERLFFLPEVRLPATAELTGFSEDSGPVRQCTPPLADVDPPDDALVASLDAACFVWPREPEFRLSDVGVRLPHGALVAVVGATASGKSSLLMALLGEMPSDGGLARVQRQHPLGFAPQQPWLFNGTLRQNVLFGEAFVERRYADCLRCCALEQDLEILRDGDRTRVGERGIALSGGQKSRVCLARAAYLQSGFVVLDDPYSALDAHVARRVHKEAILGLLAGQTRVVATNRLEFVGSCDLIVVLDGGRVQAVGSFDEVQQSSAILRGLLEAQGLSDAPQHLARQLTPASSGEEAPGAEAAEGKEKEGDDEKEEEEEQEEEEARATGQVKRAVVRYYLQSMGGIVVVSLLAGVFLLAEVVQLAIPIWLARWTAASPGHIAVNGFLVPYVALSVATVFMMTGREVFSMFVGLRAARRLHRAMFDAVLRAPMSFFQDTPHGRIINRFSKDMSEIDKELFWTLTQTLVPVVGVLGNFVMVGSTAVLSLLVFVPLLWLYVRLWRFYSKAALDIKRISKVLSSPVYNHFGNLCRENAVCVVRAHHQVQQQVRINDGLVAEQQRPEYAELYVESWFSMRMDHLGCVLVLTVSLCVVLGRGRYLSASSAALALTFAEECSSSIQGMMGQLAEVAVAFNCVERVHEYATQLPTESAMLTERQLPSGWPSQGELEVSNLALRYKPHLPLALRCLSFRAAPGERLGICGRTGSGKSSLLLALLRIVEPEPGTELRLDGEDLLTLGLEDVRRAVVVVPQEPVLFQASLRENCDPFNEHTTAQVWAAVEAAQLAGWAQQCAGEDSEALAIEVKEQSLSMGQRQLLAMARAVLRRAHMVLLDEATAAVDATTEAALQHAMQQCFAGATMLTVSHRLRLIEDYDRVLVLDSGEIVEEGPPSELRAQERSIFRKMLEESARL